MWRRISSSSTGERGMILGVFALMAAALAFTGSDTPPPRVAVTGGAISGSDVGDALLFRGIPYAAPPTGQRRWRAPGPVVAWRGVRSDNADAPACPQNDQGWNHGDAIRASEDCLTLDIRTAS